MSQPMPCHPRARGMSLLEVLIAVAVLSIGLLGLAALHVTSLRHSQSAYQRSQATILISEIVDLMRANRASAEAGAYDVALTVDPTGGSTIADTDIQRWKQTLAQALPGGDGSIDVDAGGAVVILVQWQDERNASAAPLQFVLETQL